MNNDDFAAGVMMWIWWSEGIYRSANAIACTVVQVARSDDGRVEQLIVRREDDGSSMLVRRPRDASYFRGSALPHGVRMTTLQEDKDNFKARRTRPNVYVPAGILKGQPNNDEDDGPDLSEGGFFWDHHDTHHAVVTVTAKILRDEAADVAA